ncbi:MAG UNVERIFIED_CONTAM: hypothetical protein LVT10_23395 [Anaerolineae bacterium]
MPLRGGKPRPITPSVGHVASPVISPDHRWVLTIHEDSGQQSLAITPLDGKAWARQLLKGYDFIMQPTWHPNGEEIACITWDAQHMPWQEARLPPALVGHGGTTGHRHAHFPHAPLQRNLPTVLRSRWAIACLRQRPRWLVARVRV